MLVLVARAAPAAATAEPAAAQWALARTVSTVPVWVAAVLTGVVRAGSPALADVRGANAVAGLALARGETLVVAGCWLAALASLLALALPLRTGLLVSSSPLDRLEAIALFLQAVLVVTLFAGPQINGARDVVPWTAGAVVASLALAFGARRALPYRTPAVAGVVATIGLVLAAIGARS